MFIFKLILICILFVLFYFVYVVYACVFTSMEVRGSHWVSSSFLILFFEATSLPEPESYQFNKTVWAGNSGGSSCLFLTLPLLPPPLFFYFSAKDPNSSLHACMVVTFWLGHLSGLCLFFFFCQLKNVFTWYHILHDLFYSNPSKRMLKM